MLDEVFSKEKPEAVIHFAAYIQVGESVEEPQKYFYNNLVSTLNLLRAMLDHNVKKIVFSSTSAVYGQPEVVPVEENASKNPANPYGKSAYLVCSSLWFASSSSPIF